jgi:hypothetical protein
MADRGFTIKVERVAAMRALAIVIRNKTQEFERARVGYPEQFAAQKKQALRLVKQLECKLVKAKTVEQTHNWYEVEWKARKDIFSSPPTLNVYSEKHALEMLERDVRKVISINSNSDLWAMLQQV